MVNRVAHLVVDLMAGVAIGTVAIVAWWLGLAVFLVTLVTIGKIVALPTGPVVIVGMVVYCFLSLPACRWLERKVF